MGSAELRSFAEGHLQDLCIRFPLTYIPKIEWRGFRVTAGMAYYQAGVIGLSHRVLTTPEAVAHTLGHEYAHLLAYSRAGKHGTGHGASWKKAMRDLGLEPTVHHNYAVERNTRRQQVDYLCVRCGITITRKRRLPARRKYVHAKCGGDLRLLRISKVT